eukprot:8948610-Ditylum_brightwellii.AAC.1
MSLDIVKMYPLVHVKLIQKALQYYAKDIPNTAKETIDLCMDIVQFGGAAKGKEFSDEDVTLAIRAYESVFLADIVASYVFEETEECFRECMYRGINRDDGLVVFVGTRNKREILEACAYDIVRLYPKARYGIKPNHIGK